MTTTKHRISSKIFVASIVAVIILSLLISPIMAITVTAATSSDASYSDEFKGYGEEKTNEEIHLLTRLTSPSEDAPSMTVLVHGQGGNAHILPPSLFKFYFIYFYLVHFYHNAPLIWHSCIVNIFAFQLRFHG